MLPDEWENFLLWNFSLVVRLGAHAISYMYRACSCIHIDMLLFSIQTRRERENDLHLDLVTVTVIRTSGRLPFSFAFCFYFSKKTTTTIQQSFACVCACVCVQHSVRCTIVSNGELCGLNEHVGRKKLHCIRCESENLQSFAKNFRYF